MNIPHVSKNMILRMVGCVAVIMSVFVQASVRLGAQQWCGNPNDWEPDDTALQNCLDAGGVIALQPGSPGYIVNGLNGDHLRGMYLWRDDTVLTSSMAPTRATIIAGRDLFTHILRTPPHTDVWRFRIEYITFEGKVDDFWGPDPYRTKLNDCTDPGGAADPSPNPGNLLLQGYGPFQFKNNEVMHALCGSGLALWGDFEVSNNYIAYNGRDRNTPGDGTNTRWSDGITVMYCQNGDVTNNTFVDNTDIALALGGGNCTVTGNEIAQFGKYANAGISVGYFDSPVAGNHSGSFISGNLIRSGEFFGHTPDHLGVGILLGTHPWSSGFWVSDVGNVSNNTSKWNVVNMVIDGVGSGGSVSGNALFENQGSEGIGNCVGTANYVLNQSHSSLTPQSGWIPGFYDDTTNGGGCGW